jgi:hypothetical protein
MLTRTVNVQQSYFDLILELDRSGGEPRQRRGLSASKQETVKV